MVETIKRHYPQVTILARAYHVNHLYLLKRTDVDHAVREMSDGRQYAWLEGRGYTVR